MVRIRREVIGLVLIAFVVAVFMAGWWFWWLPKTEFSCDGNNSGAPTVDLAATRFVQTVIDGDALLACAYITNKLPENELADAINSIKTELGDPTDAGKVRISCGAREGSTYALLLEGPSGSVEASVLSFQGWYRVILPIENEE